jgi:maltose alpha-D-glucosyltransferase / alpha-amylase
LSDAERARVFQAFAPEKGMQLYDRGIRRRLAPMLDGDRRRLELAYSLLFSLPGTPVIRYGDELGMGEDLRLPERACARTPMQWSTEPQAGFSKARKTVLPVISDGPFGYEKVNAGDQRRDPQSMLNWTERVIRMRKECPELGWGDFAALRTGHDEVLALRFAWRGNAMVTLHNLAGRPLTAALSAKQVGSDKLVNLFADDHSSAVKGRHRVDLEPYGYRWYRVGALDYLLRRRAW